MARPGIGFGLKWLALAALLSQAAHPAAAETLKFNMSWLPQGTVGGVLVAQAKGFFAAAGLVVESSRGYGAQRTVNEIDQGLFDLGYADPISVMLNHRDGGHTILVGAINTRWPAGLCFLKNAHEVSRPADLKGLTLAGNPGSPVQNIVPAWFKLNGLPADTLRMVRMDGAVYNAALIAGRIDLSECWEGSSVPIVDAMAAADGKSVGVILYRDFGLDIYGSGFVTTSDFVKNKPDTLKRFLKQAYRGYDYMAKNPGESADLIIAKYPTLDRAILIAQIAQTTELLADPAEAGQPLGWLGDARMHKTLAFAVAAFDLPAGSTPGDFYSDAFLQ